MLKIEDCYVSYQINQIAKALFAKSRAWREEGGGTCMYGAALFFTSDYWRVGILQLLWTGIDESSTRFEKYRCSCFSALLININHWTAKNSDKCRRECVCWNPTSDEGSLATVGKRSIQLGSNKDTIGEKTALCCHMFTSWWLKYNGSLARWTAWAPTITHFVTDKCPIVQFSINITIIFCRE